MSSRVANILRSRDGIRAAVAMGYCCVAFSAPFAGAAVVSKRADHDKRYENLRPLGFRNCLPGSPLEDFAGIRKQH